VAVEAAAEPRQQEEQQEQQQARRQEPQTQLPPPPQQQQRWRVEPREEGLPSKGPFWRLTGSGFPEAAPLTAARQRQQQGTPAEQRQRRQQDAEEQQQEQADAPVRPLQQEQQQRRARQQQGQAKPQSLYLGVTSVPLPPAGNRAGVDSMPPRTQQELNEQQEQKEQLQSAYPAFGLRRTSSSNGSSTTSAPTRNGNGSGTPIPASLAGLNGISRAKPAPPVAAAEVHLRRLDTFETLHRRAVAAITIDAPPEVRKCAQRSCGLATPVRIS
jgi:hypothetical protein